MDGLGNFGMGSPIGEIQKASNAGLLTFVSFCVYLCVVFINFFSIDSWIGIIISYPYDFLLNFSFFQSSLMDVMINLVLSPLFWVIVVLLFLSIVFFFIDVLFR